MSAPAPGGAPTAAWQREDVVASFAERRRILIPLLDLQEDVILKLLNRGGRPVARFLDLGCGAGAMSELVLCSRRQAGVEADGVLVDFSEPMLARAGESLARFPGRWQLVRGDLSHPGWREGLPGGRYDAVVSGLAIHHIPTARKRELFAEVLELLEPGGTFVNMDYVAVAGPLTGLFDEQMLANAVEHAASVQGAGEEGHRHGGDGQAQGVDFDDDEDRPDTVEDQLAWLRDAGFADVEVHFKWAEAAVFGGVRPGQTTEERT